MVETGFEPLKEPLTFIQTVIQRAEYKLALVEQYPNTLKEEKTKISANARHFLNCLALVHPEKKTKIESPTELVEALNEIAKEEKKPLFFKQGESFFCPEMKKTFKIIRILPPSPVELPAKEVLYLPGTNLWDIDPPLGSRFIPCVYFFEQVTT